MVKYDIPTLLDLRQDARIDLTRFSDQAFGNNLLRQRQASTSVLSEQPVNRSRNASNYSRQSERTLSIIEPAVLRPSRQPSDPPQGVRAQTDAGFARFLKEHTSPKHQRVTAGGRIVPMEPSSPTPKPKELVPSKDVKMDDEIMSKVASKNENKSKLENRQLQPTDANASINMPKAASQLAGSHVNQPLIMHPSGTLDQQFSGCGQIPNLLSAAATTGIFSQPNLPWSLDNQQLPQLGLQVPDITLSAASDYGMYNFGADPYTWLPNMYQALNTQGPIAPSMPTVQPYPTVTTSSDFSTGSNTSSGGAASIFSQFPTGYESVYPSLGLQWQQYTGGQVPLLTPPVVPSPLQTPTYQKSLEDAAKEHESLTGQLSRIDRYMAIHSWDLDQQSKNLLVEQRMSLVRELDAVRIYREHLEWASGRFGTSASLRHNVMNPATAPANMYAANSLAGSQTLLGPGLCAASSSCTAPTFPMFPLMNALSQPLTMSEPMNAAAAPFHATVDTHPYENNTFQAEACASRTSFREAGLKPPRAVGTCAEPLRSDKEVQTLSEAKPISRDKPVAGWKTPTKDGPPELRKVYDQIEEAVRRGEPLGGLLKDLSAATSQLVKERVSEKEERYGSLRSPSSKPGKPHAKAHTGSEAYALKGISDRHEAYAPFARPSRKLWKSGNDLRRPIHGKNRPFGVEDEDDVKSTSSYLSTTDSWATIHEGDSRCLDKLAPEGKGKGVCRDVLPERRPRDPFERPTVSAEALRSTIRRTGAQNLSVTGELAAYKPRSSATLMGSNNSGRQTSVEEMRQPYPQLLTQYFNKDRGLAFQKTAALAVSQNVNAHGFLPPFEGVGNAPQSRRKAKECAEP